MGFLRFRKEPGDDKNRPSIKFTISLFLGNSKQEYKGGFRQEWKKGIGDDAKIKYASDAMYRKRKELFNKLNGIQNKDMSGR